MAYILKPNANDSYILRSEPNVILSAKAFGYAITARISGFAQLAGIAYDPDVTKKRFFVVQQYGNGIVMVNSDTLSIVTVLPESMDYWFTGLCRDPDPELPIIYAAERNGIYILNTNDLSMTKVYDHDEGGFPCRWITVDPDIQRDRILFTYARWVVVIKRSDFSFVAKYELSLTSGDSVRYGCEGIAFDPIKENNRFLLVNRVDKILKLIDGSNFQELRRVTDFSGEPMDIMFDELNQFNTFLMTDIYGLDVVRSFTSNGFEFLSNTSGFSVPVSLIVDPDLTKERYFVTNYASGEVTVMSKV